MVEVILIKYNIMKTAVRINSEEGYEDLMFAYAKKGWVWANSFSQAKYKNDIVGIEFCNNYNRIYELGDQKFISVEEAIKRLEGEEITQELDMSDSKLGELSSTQIEMNGKTYVEKKESKFTPAQELFILDCAREYMTHIIWMDYESATKHLFDQAEGMLKEAQSRGLLQD